MDPQFIATVITTAATALAAGVQDGVKEAAKSAIVDGYEHGLKPILRRKYAAQSTVMKSIAKVEVNPTSPKLYDTLVQDLAKVNAHNDHEVEDAANQLSRILKYYQININNGIQLIGSGRQNFHGPVYQNPPPYAPSGYALKPTVQIKWSVIIAVFVSALVMISVAFLLEVSAINFHGNFLIRAVIGEILFLVSLGLGITAFSLFIVRIIRGH